MGESEPLKLSEDDVRGIVRLLSEALSPDDGRNPKAARLMSGLAEMADADGWIFFRSRLPKGAGHPANIDYLYGGAFNQQSLAEYADYSLETDGQEHGEFSEVKRLVHEGEHFTKTREQMVSEAAWRSGTYDQHIEKMGLDAFVYSTVPLTERDGATITSTALLFRKPGRPEFDERVCRIIHLVISECGPLHREGLNMETVDDVAELTPRQRSVLVLLIDGLSVKQVATALGLSYHTVNGHVKAIYRYFGVQSRAELLRKFM